MVTKVNVYIAYIPPEHKPRRVGASRWLVGLDPQRGHFTLSIPTSRYPKTIADPSLRYFLVCVALSELPFNATPNLMRAGGIWSCWPTFALGSHWAFQFHVCCLLLPHKCGFWWIMGLSLLSSPLISILQRPLGLI